MSAVALGRTRFAYSPLTEVGESLYMLSSGRIPPLHRPWFDEIRGRLRRVDLELLRVAVPRSPLISEVLFVGVTDPATTIDSQLRVVAELPTEFVQRELREVWQDCPLPERADQLIADSYGGSRRLADTLGHYWSVAIEPYWRAIRAALDDDVAHRASVMSRGGVHAMLADLHPEISVHADTLHLEKRQRPSRVLTQRDLPDSGLLLVPSVFIWPRHVLSISPVTSPMLTYAARGVGNVFGGPDAMVEDASLGALLGRSRAEILVLLMMPQTTTELAVLLGQSPSSVSQHLSVLRASGLVTSWRNGRRVLYRRTELATAMVYANSAFPADATA